MGRFIREAPNTCASPGSTATPAPAHGGCPIGALQAVIGSWKFKAAFYISGILIFIGALVGRFVCGWLCPFGLIQELLHKIPFVKKIGSFRGDRLLRKLKYVILVVFVILLPMFLVDMVGQGAPYFCKLICPAGTLEGGLPLVLLNEGLRSAIGWLYAWKNLILVLTLLACIVIYRPSASTSARWGRSTPCLTGCPCSATGWTARSVSTAASAPEPVRCRSIRRRRPTMQSASVRQVPERLPHRRHSDHNLLS